MRREKSCLFLGFKVALIGIGNFVLRPLSFDFCHLSDQRLLQTLAAFPAKNRTFREPGKKRLSG